MRCLPPSFMWRFASCCHLVWHLHSNSKVVDKARQNFNFNLDYMSGFLSVPFVLMSPWQQWCEQTILLSPLRTNTTGTVNWNMAAKGVEKSMQHVFGFDELLCSNWSRLCLVTARAAEG